MSSNWSPAFFFSVLALLVVSFGIGGNLILCFLLLFCVDKIILSRRRVGSKDKKKSPKKILGDFIVCVSFVLLKLDLRSFCSVENLNSVLVNLHILECDVLGLRVENFCINSRSRRLVDVLERDVH